MTYRAILLTDPTDGVKVSSVWHWYSRDPFAVHVEFIGDEVREWVFDRQLVIDGIEVEVGLHDVKLWPLDEHTVRLGLSSPDGACELDCPRAELRKFVRDMTARLPDEWELSNQQMDAFLKRYAYLKDADFGPLGGAP